MVVVGQWEWNSDDDGDIGGRGWGGEVDGNDYILISLSLSDRRFETVKVRAPAECLEALVIREVTRRARKENDIINSGSS